VRLNMAAEIARIIYVSNEREKKREI